MEAIAELSNRFVDDFAAIDPVRAAAISRPRWAGTGVDGAISAITEQYGEGKLRSDLEAQTRRAADISCGNATV